MKFKYFASVLLLLFCPTLHAKYIQIFYKNIENKQIHTYQDTYKIQAATFKNKNNALKYKVDLQRITTYPVYIVRKKIKQNIFYLVNIGPIPSSEEIKKITNHLLDFKVLKSKSIIKCKLKKPSSSRFKLPKFSFLKNKKPTTSYVIQVGSFKKETNARKYQNQLQEITTYPICIVNKRLKQKLFYRVSIGPIPTDLELKKTTSLLLNSKFSKHGFIVKRIKIKNQKVTPKKYSFLKNKSSRLWIHNKWNSNFLLKLPQNGHIILQGGAAWSTQGTQQFINIQNIIGDKFTVTSKNSINGLAGLAYFIDGRERKFFQTSYGINAFYLAKAKVSGNVIQENLFENLSYSYNITNYPLLFVAKATIPTKYPKYSYTVDAGIGPNFMTTSGFKETHLDSITIPDNLFAGHTTTTLSATTGIGIKINKFIGKASFECGYRFFYLGKGNFNKNTDQLVNTLSTGNSYANALICSISN